MVADLTMKQRKRCSTLVIVQKNKQMPFVLGTTIHESEIDYMLDTDFKKTDGEIRFEYEFEMLNRSNFGFGIFFLFG